MPPSNELDIAASLLCKTMCSGDLGPNPMLVHTGAASFGKSIQKFGLFHCLKDSSGTATAEYIVISMRPSNMPAPARPPFDRMNWLTMPDLETVPAAKLIRPSPLDQSRHK